jgi:hypothetical protein
MTEKILKKDSDFIIEHNCNCDENEGNGFLYHFQSKQCTGEYRKNIFTEKWDVMISKAYDEETGSDDMKIGEFETRTGAIECLWDNRHQSIQN